jgi:hypothetical protein
MFSKSHKLRGSRRFVCQIKLARSITLVLMLIHDRIGLLWLRSYGMKIMSLRIFPKMNRFDYLGNGFARRELDGSDLTWYMHDPDELY